MNVENDFLTDFDLFGKTPEIYYKGRSKKSSVIGIVFTVIYIIVYIAFLIYKLIRMFKRIDVTFYDSYTFQGLPSIKLTNNEFYGGFGMGRIVDERMYHLTVEYISLVKHNGQWEPNDYRQLETEICQLEWFGSEYQDLFADDNINNYYCIKDVKGLILEGYSNLERFSYFKVKFYPCANYTSDGRECYDYTTKSVFFENNNIELKLQDNDLNPENYNYPITRRQVDMNSPVFKDIYQLIYSYIQIVNIETDEDITGLNFFTEHIRKEQYTRYDESFIITSPLFYGDILISGGPIAEVTLQLAAKVLTEKRQYTQLIDVLGDVGGLMEIIFTFLNLISSLVTEVLYDRSLINSLFSFDLNKKYVVFNKARYKNVKSNGDNYMRDVRKLNTIKLQQKFQDLENNKNIEIYAKEIPEDQNMVSNNGNSTKRKKIIKVIKKRKSQKNSNTKITNLSQSKEQNTQNENIQNLDNRLSIDENNKIISIDNVANDSLGNANDNKLYDEKDLKYVYINNWLICCFWCTNRKKNVNKVLFEEGSKILTERLDIMNMFNYLYSVEIIQKKLGIEAKGMNMSENCINDIQT